MLLSEAVNEAVQRMRRTRPPIAERMLVISCSRCGASFAADEIPVKRTGAKFAYRCPTDGVDLIRVGVGVLGKGGGDIEWEYANAVRIKLDSEKIDLDEFIRSDDPT